MTSAPLVSIVCLCYNQKNFVTEAIESALTQTYHNIELIVVDDASTDGSQDVIKKNIENKDIRFVSIASNVGNCRAFNMALAECNGEYVIDLAADDVLLPHRVEIGVRDFLKNDESAGVHFTDVFLMNEKGEAISTHYKRNRDGKITEKVPQGDVYQQLIRKYFICPPSMMMRKSVLEELNGYDENLSFEDFDFWIRSSRTYSYLFNPAPLVKKRDVKKSLGKVQGKFRNNHLDSTYTVCEKIFHLNKNNDEDVALIKRCEIEIRQCIKTLNFALARKYWKLRKKTYLRLSSPSSIDK